MSGGIIDCNPVEFDISTPKFPDIAFYARCEDMIVNLSIGKRVDAHREFLKILRLVINEVRIAIY